MPFKYASGEEVLPGDRVRYAGDLTEVEFVADPATAPDDWYVKEFGGGVMLRWMDATFLPSTSDNEDLEFVSRGGQ